MTLDAVMERTPELLRWNDDVAAFDSVDDHYRNLVSAALGSNLRAVGDADADLASCAQAALLVASDTALLRVISAPDTSFRLMWEQPRSPAATAKYLRSSLLAEQAREGMAVALEEKTWSALGDALVLPSGEVTCRSPTAGQIPLDLDSPRVRKVDPLGVEHESPVWRPLDLIHRDTVLKCLDEACIGIENANPMVSAFCSKFIKVIVLQQDDIGKYVSAYSTQHYPGRAVFSNPQFIDEVQAAESIVHESIHAFLYKLSQSYPWGIRDPGYDDKPRVVSPWTGTLLPVSTFLHACFVWYGLLNFWSHALLAGSFPSRRVRGRMSRAARGFLGKSLLGMIDQPDLDLVSDPVRRAIDGMQALVQDSLAQAPSVSAR